MKTWNKLDVTVRHYAPSGNTGRRVRTKKRRTLVMIAFAEQPVAQAVVDGRHDAQTALAHFREHAPAYEKYAAGWEIARTLRLVPDLSPTPVADPAGFGVVLDPKSFRPMRGVA